MPGCGSGRNGGLAADLARRLPVLIILLLPLVAAGGQVVQRAESGGRPDPALARWAENVNAPGARADYTGWHLPLPAGQWQISRGPCGSKSPLDHDCDYYEDACAIDLVPLSGGMTGVPVLAPQAGQVFFLGTREEPGLTLMLRHADGRLSVMMHMSRVVVGPDQAVQAGQVVGYAGGSGDSGRPHLHFYIQPNAVERRCLDLAGLDWVDEQMWTATSGNLAWSDLALVDPPAHLPIWLAAQAAGASRAGVALPLSLALRPGARVELPVLAGGGPDLAVFWSGAVLQPARASTPGVFVLPITAPPRTGRYEQWGGQGDAMRRDEGQAFRVQYTVARPVDELPSRGLLDASPVFVSPASYAPLDATPQLCWQATTWHTQPPLEFRALLVGPASADSGWITETCWQPPDLPRGTYYWKVFARDSRGFMNRTNQRPAAFVIR